MAILMVLTAHVSIPPSTDAPSLMLNFLRGGGWLGVDLFFVLSGFLITGVLLDSRGSHGYFRNFYVRRVLRIWPLYYLTIAFAFGVATHIPAFETQSLHGKELVWGLFLQNVDIAITSPGENSFDMVWSLGVEEQVYLVLPAVVLFCSRRQLAWTLGGAFMFALLLRLGLGAIGAPSLAGYALTPARLDSFAVGGALALLARRGAGLAVLGRWPWVILVTGAIGLLWIAVGQFAFNPRIQPMQTWGFALAALTFGALLALSDTSASLRRIFTSPVLRIFGKYSFAIYLFHVPVWTLVRSPFLDLAIEPRWIVQLLAWAFMLVVSLAGGWLCWNLVERHALALKRHFPMSEKAAPDQFV